MDSSSEKTTIDFDRIASATGMEAGKVAAIYQSWLQGKRGKNGPAADLKLVSMLSDLSTATVSYYLNGKKGSISQERGETLQKVLECLHYSRSVAARKLRSKEKKSIAFVSPLSESPSPEFSLALLKSVKEEAKKYGYYVDVFDVEEGEEASFFANLPFLGMVDGIILSSICVDNGMLQPIVEHKLPIVDFHSWEKLDRAPVTDSIIPQNSVFSQLLTHLFLECGYRNPILVSLPPKNNITRKKKIEVYLEELDRSGIPFDPDRNIIYINRHDIIEGKKAYPEIFRRNPDVDVIICLSDLIAMTVLVELNAEGRRIPVTGYDNLDISELFGITTIDQNLADTGRMAFEKLYYAIRFVQKNGTYPAYSETVMDLKFVKRTSSLKKQSLPVVPPGHAGILSQGTNR
ncbi:MAG TPA: hypothetical protein DIC34_21570 [Treponema sp.]|nr:MAG: hypothetical protein A2001_17535 [Treponema sp. GWC1_61_84]OHE66842.1 MAG: hypothetical protein A2Y36_10665 [Treponema sp. GWA1_62_8]HCM29091.1 hypothetical protein [Treponema sp.]